MLLQDHLFKKIHNTNMDKLTTAKTLDSTYFKEHAVFKQDYKDASKAADGTKVDPFTNPDFVDKCKTHAFEEGEGFKDWLYNMYADIRASLSDKIQDQTGGVTRGDLIGLLKAIKLSIHHYELLNPDALDIEYTKCTMSVEGQNDIMTFLAVLTQYMRRLEAAGYPVRDAKAQRVLLNGLDQDIFASFITSCQRHPYDNYTQLQKALEETAANPRMMVKLKTLKPGNLQSALPTRASQQLQQGAAPALDARLDRVEAILVSLAQSRIPGTKKQIQKCYRFSKGQCSYGDKCRYEHTAPDSNNRSNQSTSNGHPKYCPLHKSSTHDASECNVLNNNPELKAALDKTAASDQRRVNTTMKDSPNGYSFMFPTRVSVPHHILAMRGSPKIDMWCVDGAATTFATYDRTKCFNIRPCNVSIFGPNDKDSFSCTEMGDALISVINKSTGKIDDILATDVLINEAFPFHIFSEILAFEKHCTAVKSLGSWQFLTPNKDTLFHASQRLLKSGSTHSDVKLYFIDEAPRTKPTPIPSAVESVQIHAAVHTPSHADMTTDPREHVTGLPQPSRAPTKPPTKITTSKNLEMLLELHCAHDHWNFEDVASYYGLSLPNPRPECWACLLSKPKRITHDKVSSRKTARVFEGFAADAKGPIDTPTPEGFIYYFLIVCLYSHHYWTILAKSQAEWKNIWPAFVKRAEAKSGKERCISFIITDGHKVNTGGVIEAFNEDRGIEGITSAPYSQWQDPAERGIQTITNGARTSLIHGGGKDWMWGWAVRHSTDSTNRMRPPKVVPGHEGKSRLRIVNPTMTLDKEMRTHKPFLCLSFKTIPKQQRGSNFNPRADPCVYLLYDPAKKAYALLTIPNLYLTYSVEVRFVTQSFPLRVTNYLANQLDTFLRPTVEDTLYSNIHGPGNPMRRQRLANPVSDSTTIVEHTPVLVRQPVEPSTVPGPGWSSTRGYRPTVAGLESAAYIATASTNSQRSETVTTFTPDQLAARTPKRIHQALGGPDAEYWLPSVLADFRIIRDNKCIINVTDVRPPGPAPPAVEQRFKIKYRGDKPISLCDIPPKDWKARTVTRGDRFKHGVHYDATAAPVVHTPALKMLVAWAVAKNLQLFQWDQTAAFYGNEMDRKGVIVQLPPGFDPHSDVLRPLDAPPLYGELGKALPGIPQGSLLHYKELSPALQELDFQPIAADNCLFLHRTIEMATSLHVDDGVLAAPSHKHAEQVLGPNGLGGKKAITWGPLHNTLGIDFAVVYSAEQRMVFMSQRAYAVTILERAGMLDCNPARTPASPGQKYTKADCPCTDEQKATMQAKGMSKERYHSIVASLNFLVCITRDDMRFIQGKLAKYCLNPGTEHFKAMKHALRFLKDTLDYGIEFI